MKRIAPALIRAAIGAFAGFALMGLVALLAVDNYGIGARVDSAERGRFVLRAITGGAAFGAVVAALFGGAEIGGRTGAVIKGLVIGGLAGVLTGLFVGNFVASTLDAPAKSVVSAGIFGGLALGVILGGIVGAALPVAPERKPPVSQIDGLGD
jgi:hypothetical protein